jgi:hypothetical protein
LWPARTYRYGSDGTIPILAAGPSKPDSGETVWKSMNPSVSFPSDTLLPAVVEAVKPDIKPAAQIVGDTVREGGEHVIAEMRPE